MYPSVEPIGPSGVPRVITEGMKPCDWYLPCCACGEPIDCVGDHLLLIAGSNEEPVVLAAAHASWANEECPAELRARWRAKLRLIGAGTLRHEPRDKGDDRPSWYLDERPVPTGTPIDVLDAYGTWIPGELRYYPDWVKGVSPYLQFWTFHGGWDSPPAETSLSSYEEIAVRIRPPEGLDPWLQPGWPTDRS